MGLRTFLSNNETAIRGWVDTASKVAQVLALVLAGLWTYKTFSESEAPNLEPQLDTSSTVWWSSVPGNDGICEADVNVRVENTGKAAVDVTSVGIGGWISDIPRNVDKSLLIPPESLQRGDKFAKEDDPVSSQHLIGHFPPHSARNESFTWYFKKQPDKIAFWKFKFGSRQNLRSNSGSTNWDYLCRGPEEIQHTEPISHSETGN